MGDAMAIVTGHQTTIMRTATTIRIAAIDTGKKTKMAPTNNSKTMGIGEGKGATTNRTTQTLITTTRASRTTQGVTISNRELRWMALIHSKKCS